MNRNTPRASRALRQVGRDTTSAGTRDSAAFAADQAHFERFLRLNPAPKNVVHIRPSDVKAHRARRAN
jgi:hypothetical protein